MISTPKDKVLHFIAGLVISIIAALIFKNPLYGLFASIVAGIAKECYDDYTYGVFYIKDMIATWIGGACGFAVVSLIQYWRT